MVAWYTIKNYVNSRNSKCSNYSCMAVVTESFSLTSKSPSLFLTISFSVSLSLWVHQSLSEHSSCVFSLAVLTDGRLASGSDDNTVRIWNRGTDGQYTCAQVPQTPLDTGYTHCHTCILEYHGAAYLTMVNHGI